LRDHPGRAGDGVGDAEHLSLQPGLPVLQHGLRLGGRGDFLRPDHYAVSGALAPQAEDEVGQPMSDSGPVGVSTPLSPLRFAFAVFLLVSPAILVFLWMLSLAFKNEVDNTAFPPVFIPNPPTLKNFVDVLEKNNFLLYF